MTAPTVNSFEVTVTGEWTEEYLPTPRHRKLRERQVEEQVIVQVRHVTAEQAPVAFAIDQAGGGNKLMRLYDGRLYVEATLYANQVAPAQVGDETYPARQVFVDFRDHGSRDELEQAIRARYGHDLIIDGAVWRRSSEPLYTISTFGMGGNHSGTGLMVDYTDQFRGKVDLAFRADEYELALAKATKIARDRGDTESVPRFTQRIEVLIPEAVTADVPREPEGADELRWEHWEAANDYSRAIMGGTEPKAADAWERMNTTRQKLLALTGGIVDRPQRRVTCAYTD